MERVGKHAVVRGLVQGVAFRWNTKTRAREEWSPEKARKARWPTTIEGELVAASSGEPAFRPGERVQHQKFGAGTIADVDGNKLTIDFDTAGRKRVVDSFVARG